MCKINALNGIIMVTFDAYIFQGLGLNKVEAKECNKKSDFHLMHAKQLSNVSGLP